LQVNGSFAATTKSFVIDHPSNPGMKLRYGSLESPYHGIRLTGQGQITAGVAMVNLPGYICDLVQPDDVNIQITNIQHGKTIWVDSVNIPQNMFTVKCDVSDSDMKSYGFYWSFTAIRKDISPMLVEY